MRLHRFSHAQVGVAVGLIGTVAGLRRRRRGGRCGQLRARACSALVQQARHAGEFGVGQCGHHGPLGGSASDAPHCAPWRAASRLCLGERATAITRAPPRTAGSTCRRVASHPPGPRAGGATADQGPEPAGREPAPPHPRPRNRPAGHQTHVAPPRPAPARARWPGRAACVVDAGQLQFAGMAEQPAFDGAGIGLRWHCRPSTGPDGECPVGAGRRAGEALGAIGNGELVTMPVQHRGPCRPASAEACPASLRRAARSRSPSRPSDAPPRRARAPSAGRRGRCPAAGVRPRGARTARNSAASQG